MRTLNIMGAWHYSLTCRSNAGSNIGTPIISMSYGSQQNVKGLSPYFGVLQGNVNTITQTTTSYYMPPGEYYQGATFYDDAGGANDVGPFLQRVAYGEATREFYVGPSDTLVFGAYEGNSQTVFVYYSFIWITE